MTAVRYSLWNAAHDDTIPDPATHKRRIQGLHNTGWLWNVGDHTTGESVYFFCGPVSNFILLDV